MKIRITIYFLLFTTALWWFRPQSNKFIRNHSEYASKSINKSINKRFLKKVLISENKTIDKAFENETNLREPAIENLDSPIEQVNYDASPVHRFWEEISDSGVDLGKITLALDDINVEEYTAEEFFDFVLDYIPEDSRELFNQLLKNRSLLEEPIWDYFKRFQKQEMWEDDNEFMYRSKQEKIDDLF